MTIRHYNAGNLEIKFWPTTHVNSGGKSIDRFPRYEFDITLSTHPQSAEPPGYLAIKSPEMDTPTPLSKRLSHSQIIAKLFLCDQKSVDVPFLFETKDAANNRATYLWAHKQILSRIPGLETMIQDAVRNQASCHKDCANKRSLYVHMPSSIELAPFSCLVYNLHKERSNLLSGLICSR
ncbi:hypothetical protein FBU30_010774 [Linnemannia zychae]|nr:hypothetical protein FBU30_010774 [Linnemannia zychae]